MGMAAAAGWATSPSAEVQPEGGDWGSPGVGCRAWHSQLGDGWFCATCMECLQQPGPQVTRGRSPGAPTDSAQYPGPHPGPTTLSGCIPLGCHSAEQAVQGASPMLPMGTSLSPVNCGRPEADFNSVVYGNDWWVGSVVRYSCRPGFLLLGDPASACQSDGRWTPKPTCLREYGWVSCGA